MLLKWLVSSPAWIMCRLKTEQDKRLPIPVACGNYTEMTYSEEYTTYNSSGKSKTISNLDELKAIISQHVRLLQNPEINDLPILCLITKQVIPESLISYFERMLIQETKLKIAIFNSVSFLPGEIESGIPPYKTLVKNFEIIQKINREVSDHECRIAGIHFWRPLIKGLNDKNMGKNITLIKEYGAKSSIAVGLKLSKKLLEYLISENSRIRRVGGLNFRR